MLELDDAKLAALVGSAVENIVHACGATNTLARYDLIANAREQFLEGLRGFLEEAWEEYQLGFDIPGEDA